MAAAPKAPQAAPRPANPLLDPTQTLSGKPLQQAANQIANAQTAGPLTELAKQIAQNQQRGQNAQSQTFGYYMQLAKQAQGDLAQTQAQGSSLSSQLGTIGQGTQQALGQLGQQAQGGALGRMNALGLGGDSAGQLQAETSRLQGIGALNSGAFQSAGVNEAANFNQNAASNLGTFALRGQERIGDIGRATQLANEPLAAKQAGLIASKGALAATALGSLRQQERNYQIAQQGLGLKGQALSITQQNNLANQALKAQGLSIQQQNNLANQLLRQSQQGLTARGQNLSHQDRQAMLALRAAAQNAKKGGQGALSPNQQNVIYSQIDRIQALIADGQANGLAAAKIKQGLQSGLNPAKAHYAAILIEAAYELKGWGHVLPQTANALRAMGLRGGRYKVGPAPATPTLNAPGNAISGAAGAIGQALGAP